MTREVTIVSIQQLTPDVKRFVLEADDHVFEYEPGQHTRIRYDTDTGNGGMSRPYTATTHPGTNTITLAIKHVEDGAASTYMHERDVGDDIHIEHLAGNLTLEHTDRDVVFISTGVGITPMMAMLRQYLYEGTGDAVFFLGERDDDHLIYRDTFDEFDDERLAPYFDESNMDSLIAHQSAFIGMVAGGPDYHHHTPDRP